MTEVHRLEAPESAAASRAIDAASNAVSDGRLVILPTDTVYGIAARPDVAEATARLFAAKRRPRRLTIPVLVPDAGTAEAVAVVDERARAVAARLWPGALTLVLPRSARSRPWDLGDERETVGVRAPDHGVALAVLHRTGPLAVTSANRSGEPELRTCEELVETFGEEVAVYLCAGEAAGIPSTVLDLTGPEARVVRAGAVPPGEVLALAAGSGTAHR